MSELQKKVDGKGYRLIAGYHRLEACKAIGWLEIDATVVDLNDLEAELAEIDENLIRNEFTKLERDENWMRRQPLYNELHPEAQAQRPQGGGNRPNVVDTVSTTFAEDTAGKSGVSARTVRRGIQIARDIPQDVRDVLRDTPVADSTTDLLTIARQPAFFRAEFDVIRHGRRSNVQKFNMVDAQNVKDVKRLTLRMWPGVSSCRVFRVSRRRGTSRTRASVRRQPATFRCRRRRPVQVRPSRASVRPAR